MFARAIAPVVAPEQAALFYLYTHDLPGLRAHLLGAGLRDGGEYRGCPTRVDGRGRVWGITHPDSMPLGEIRVEDPDGYCLLIGHLGDAGGGGSA